MNARSSKRALALFLAPGVFVFATPLTAFAEPPSKAPPALPAPTNAATEAAAPTPPSPSAAPAAPASTEAAPAVPDAHADAHAEAVHGAAPAPVVAIASPRASLSMPEADEPSALASGDVHAERPRYDYFRIAAGARVGYVGNAGFDTFASNDTLAQFSLEGTYAFASSRRLAIAAGLAWDVGGRSSGLRGLETNLTVHRLTVPIEGRYHVTPWLYAFGRVAPGTAAFITDVTDGSSPASLAKTSWVFAADASLGASFLVAPHKREIAARPRSVRLWVTPEVGYAFTTKADVEPRPDRNQDDVLGADQRANLGSLATNGFFWRVSAALTF